MKANQPSFLKSILARFTSESYPFPPGSQNRDGFERNHDNPLHGWNEDSALYLSAFWACVRLLAETISTLPLNIYERMPDGTRRLANDHPLYDLIHNQPNADMTAQIFWEAYVAAMLMRGNGFGEKRFIGTRLVSIDFMEPRRVSWTSNPDGSLTFRYTGLDGVQRVIPESRMFHTLGFTTDGRMGLSAIRYGAKVLYSARSADTAANSTFSKGLMPTTYFKYPKVLQKQQRDEARTMIKKISGAMNAGEPAILEAEMDVGTIGINPVDAQLLASRGWSVEEICRLFRVPPFMIGHSDKVTSWGTGIEQQMIGFLTFVLRPWLNRIEQSIRKNLLSPADKSRFYAEFAIEGLLRADSQARAALYSSAGQNGWMTRNEMRALENLPPEDGGDVLTVQSNLIPLSQLGEGDEGADNVRDALKNWLGMFEKGLPNEPQK